MNSSNLRDKFLNFFKARGHTIVPSSSLIPDDPSVLFTTAGMQQFKRYFTGELDPMKDFGSKNVVSVQKCFRTSDINEVGDESHLTFFEMLGNFSFGDYFKEGAIKYAHEFITKELGLTIDYVSVFEGDKDVPADEESIKIWRSLGITNIKKLGRKDNFWGPTGNEGPCGPTSEVYIRGVEVWNLVFNEYYQDKNKKLAPLKIKGIDTGLGLERLTMMAQGKPTIFETDAFVALMELLPEDMDVRKKRIIADHSRSIAFLISDGVRPSNKEAGYVLRRLMRRTVSYGGNYDIMLNAVIANYGGFYANLDKRIISEVFREEEEKFRKTLETGTKELAKLNAIDAQSAFRLYESYGLPYEVIKELGGAKAGNLTSEDFDKEFEKHQEISRAGVEKKFGGHGLTLDTGELKAGGEEEQKKVIRFHTATHLLHQALLEVLGNEVEQRGSDITPERTRFDFTFSRKVTPEELKRIEEIVNEKIKADLPIKVVEMSKAEAEKTGALKFFKGKYGDKVTVYFIGDSLENAFNKEFCGGPHVTRTGEIGKFKITKEESSSAGIRRIRAVVE